MALAIWMGICGSALAETVELKSGEKLEGTILDSNDDYVEMEHAVLGRIKIPADEIKPPDEPKVKPGLFGTSFLEGWNKALSAGLSGSDGKSNEISANVDFKLNREIERHRSSYVTRFNFDRSDGSTTDNQLFTRYLHDFLFTDSEFFTFLSAAYLLDTQQNWLHRVSGATGVGYRFVKTDQWDVLGRFGGGVSRTMDDRRDDTSDEYPLRTEVSGLVGLEATWSYAEGQSLSLNSLYLHNFLELSGLRSVSRFEWKIPAGIIEGLGFLLGTSFIYDSHEEGKLRRDLKYYANVAYDF